MFEFIKIQYALGRLTDAQVHNFVRKKFITEAQAKEILSEV